MIPVLLHTTFYENSQLQKETITCYALVLYLLYCGYTLHEIACWHALFPQYTLYEDSLSGLTLLICL